MNVMLSETMCARLLCLVMMLACVVLAGGCISPKKTVEQPILTVTPEMTTVQTAPQAAFGSQTDMTTSRLPYGITISYPVTWRKDEPKANVLRDYGRNVINIASFRSPAITSDRAAFAAPNPDESQYTGLSIDVDPEATRDFEEYFNRATLAVNSKYGKIDITKRNVVLWLSVTDTFSGYKSYELDFDTKDRRGKYIFTNVDGTVYIFAFRNPSPYSKEVENIYKSILISPEVGEDDWES